MSQLQKWRSHKVVEAGQIVSLGAAHPNGDTQHTLQVKDHYGAPMGITVPGDFFARGMPAVGDYLVVYEDGYKSWSPAAAFEAGYTKA